MKILVNQKVFVIGVLCGLPVITWALLAWEPFDRLLAHFFPEMFTDEVGRFLPYTPFDALAATIVLTVYAAAPVALILLVLGMVRSVRQKGFEKTAKTVEKGVETAAVGIVTVLSALVTAVLGVVGFATRNLPDTAEQEENGLFGGATIGGDEFAQGDCRHHSTQVSDRFTLPGSAEYLQDHYHPTH